MTRNLALLICPDCAQSGEERQIIAIILINNNLTYANEANGNPKGRDHGENFNVITRARGKERWNVRLCDGLIGRRSIRKNRQMNNNLRTQEENI